MYKHAYLRALPKTMALTMCLYILCKPATHNLSTIIIKHYMARACVECSLYTVHTLLCIMLFTPVSAMISLLSVRSTGPHSPTVWLIDLSLGSHMVLPWFRCTRTVVTMVLDAGHK